MRLTERQLHLGAELSLKVQTLLLPVNRHKHDAALHHHTCAAPSIHPAIYLSKYQQAEQRVPKGRRSCITCNLKREDGSPRLVSRRDVAVVSVIGCEAFRR